MIAVGATSHISQAGQPGRSFHQGAAAQTAGSFSSGVKTHNRLLGRCRGMHCSYTPAGHAAPRACHILHIRHAAPRACSILRVGRCRTLWLLHRLQLTCRAAAAGRPMCTACGPPRRRRWPPPCALSALARLPCSQAAAPEVPPPPRAGPRQRQRHSHTHNMHRGNLITTRVRALRRRSGVLALLVVMSCRVG